MVTVPVEVADVLGMERRRPIHLTMPMTMSTPIMQDEEVGRGGEQLPGLPDAPQVAEHQQGDEGHRDQYVIGGQDPTAEVRASVPAAVDTATVRT